MRRALTVFLAAIAAGYLGLALLLYFGQRSLIYLPPAWGARVGAIERLEVPGATLGVSVRLRPGPRAALYFGGNAEAVASTLPELAEAFPDHALYALHYRGYGASGGRPTDAALHADALALYERVRGAHAEVTVVGRSLGAALAVRLAAVRPIERLVLVTPFDSLAALAAHHYPIFPVRWLLRDRYEAWRDAPRVRAPTLLIVAERDEIVPRARAEALLARFSPGIARMTLVRGASHNDISGSPEFTSLLRGETGP